VEPAVQLSCLSRESAQPPFESKPAALCFEDVLDEALGTMKASLLIAHRCGDKERSAFVETKDALPAASGQQLPGSLSGFADLCRRQLQLHEQLTLAAMIVETASGEVNELRFGLSDDARFESMCCHVRRDAAVQATDGLPSQDCSHVPGGDIDDVVRHSNTMRPGSVASASSSGISQTKGRSLLALDIVPAAVIMANALVIGLSSDIHKDSVVWEVFEVFFTVFFAAELAINLKLRGLVDYFAGERFYWNWFDAFCLLTAMMDMGITYLGSLASGGAAADLGGLMLIKMLRLARLMRLVRLLRFPIFSELKMIIQGVFSGIRVLAWAIILLTFVIFVLGIIFRKLVGDNEPELSTVPSAMFSLFRCFTGGCDAYDGTPLTERLRSNYGASFTVGYSLVYLFVTFGIFNLIMAVFIDNVSTQQHLRKLRDIGETSQATRENIIRVLDKLYQDDAGVPEETLKAFVAESFRRFTVAGKPSSGDNIVTRAVFDNWLTKSAMLTLLRNIDIETATKHELFDVLDVNMDGCLSKDEVASGLMRLRGAVTKSDIVAIRMQVRFMSKLIDKLHTCLARNYGAAVESQKSA